MGTDKEKFVEFLEIVEENNRERVEEIDQFVLNHNCHREIKTAKSGYVVSYLRKETKKTLATFVCRKTGIKVRIYPEHLNEYMEFLDDLPKNVKKNIDKSSVCKRLVNPDDCNPRCVKGYEFVMDGKQYQKCRYMAFMLDVNEGNIPYIMDFLDKELSV